ncbi:LuxR C-terminal-related transcriptional regulator [Actinomadura luzonensis]|uniref:LuxR C-terminal-related transcriptional regulator n=1 Tax=Actinomadura luzonensis TaxID=2805427 RepID=UPI0026758FBC|nr:LuxR C-terminal-related transcriptional regulator [Actinomadura luzonensis]
MNGQLGGWPFAGRRGPLASVREALASGTGVMIAGEAGVGKSRLAAHALAGLKGYAVVRALGTETAAMIPFGAFAHVLTGPPAGGENLLRWAARHLRAAGPGELLVSVDDAHRLDPASAALVHYLGEGGQARLLVTVRSGEPLPQPVAALWKDELVPRIELPPLSEDEVGRVLAGALGGAVAAETVRHLAGVSGGNALYLREVVHAGLASGCLTERDGQWRWRGPLSVSTRLRELVSERIGHLDEDEREVLELVAFGEPLGTAPLAALTSARAVERVEDRGLVAATGDGRREHLRLGHPLYGEVVRAGCGTLRTRRRLRMLAEALEATGLRRREDQLRAAVWRLDSGSATSPGTLVAAARLAWGREDPWLAARLARAAIDAGAGVSAVALLGEVLMVLGDADAAVEELRRASTEAATEGERALHACSLGINLAWAGADAEACQVLDLAAEQASDPVWRQEAYVYRCVAECFAGRLSGAARALELARENGPLTVRSAAHADSMEAWVAAYRGRTAHALAVARRTMPEADGWKDEAPHALPSFLDAMCAAQVFSGRLAGAARTAEQAMELRAAELSVSGFGAHRAMVGRLRGEVAEAVRWCADDLARMPVREPYPGRVLAEQAHALALLGRVEQAGESLAQAEELASRWPFTRQHVLHARVWVRAAAGDLDEAVRLCLEAAAHAERHELAGGLMFALHDLVRLGAAGAAAGRLAALAGLDGAAAASDLRVDGPDAPNGLRVDGPGASGGLRVDGPLAPLLARHARAVGDPAALAAVAAEFERRGLLLYAAEATAQEAAAYRDAGRGTLAKGARTRAWALARRCAGVVTPALVELATPDLTPRQRECVRLAAAGLTNRQIADRLTLSTRTAANHLQAAYDKLGVNDRTQVGRLLTAL